MKILLTIVLFICCLGYSFGQEKKVLFFGDSITAGNGMQKEQRDKAWVKLLAMDAKGKLLVVPAGKGGRSTDSEVDFKTTVDHVPKVDVVVIFLGTNDSPHITDDCVPKAVGHIKAMIDMARAAYGEKLSILIVGPPNVNKAVLVREKPIAVQRETKLKELNAAYEVLAKENKCDFVSLFGRIPDTSLAVDGIHPDAAGNVIIEKILLEKLLPVQN